MACKRPFKNGNIEYGCGSCLGCRIVRKKTWKHRILLEARSHITSSFVTLTYDDEHLPGGYCDLTLNPKDKIKAIGGTLEPKDTKKFLYRLRTNLNYENKKAREKNQPEPWPKIRYYLVGEYGEKKQRPHYHLALFGISCTGPNPLATKNKQCTCPTCGIINKSWGNANISVGILTKDSAAYVSDYVQKTVKVDGQPIMGLTNPKDPKVKKWLNGRHPEYTRMSRKPGIGGSSIDTIVRTLESRYGRSIIRDTGDVPMVLAHGGQTLPLGRYIRNKLRKALGFTDHNLEEHYKRKHEIFRKDKPLPENFTPEGSMQRLSEKKTQEVQKVHDKAKKIGKDPYKYTAQLKKKKIKEQENRTLSTAKPTNLLYEREEDL